MRHRRLTAACVPVRLCCCPLCRRVAAFRQTVPNDADLRMRRAECFMQLGQTGEAIGDVMCAPAGGRGSRRPARLTRRPCTHTHTRTHTRTHRRASKLKHNDPAVYHMLAQLHFATGARAEALAAVRECVKLDGDTKAYADLCGARLCCVGAGCLATARAADTLTPGPTGTRS